MLEISLDCVLDKNRVRGVLIRSDGKLFCRDLPSGFIVCVARAALWPARPRPEKKREGSDRDEIERDSWECATNELIVDRTWKRIFETKFVPNGAGKLRRCQGLTKYVVYAYLLAATGQAIGGKQKANEPFTNYDDRD